MFALSWVQNGKPVHCASGIIREGRTEVQEKRGKGTVETWALRTSEGKNLKVGEHYLHRHKKVG